MVGWKEVEVSGVIEVEELRAEIHERLEAGVGKDAYTCIESTLTSTEVSIGAALIQSISSRV